MKRTYIAVPDMNDSFSRIVIQKIEYLIRFTYNDTFDYWTFGLYTPQKMPIVQGIKIVPRFPLSIFCGVEGLPSIQFACSSKEERVGHNAFSDGSARFYYIEV